MAGIGSPRAGVDKGPMGERNDVENGWADVIWEEIKIGFGKPLGMTHENFSFVLGKKMVNISVRKMKGKISGR